MKMFLLLFKYLDIFVSCHFPNMAWRFAGEMDEIASTFEAASLPNGFHVAAGDVYQRLAGFKDAGELPELEIVLTALLTL